MDIRDRDPLPTSGRAEIFVDAVKKSVRELASQHGIGLDNVSLQLTVRHAGELVLEDLDPRGPQ